jgi:hypothetical protein
MQVSNYGEHGVVIDGNSVSIGSGAITSNGGIGLVVGDENRARHCDVTVNTLNINAGGAFKYGHDGNNHNTIEVGGWVGDQYTPIWHPESTLPAPTDSFRLDFNGAGSPAVRDGAHRHEVTGDGSTRTFTVEHDLIAAPTFAAVYPRNEAAQRLAPIGWTGDAETVGVRFTRPPRADQSVVFGWEAAIEGAA